ncbi:dTDP-4-amino-4,6-dideoxygalactose transaminase [Hymenobacter latericus]|uniref:dTDP-4-amino-4,6-dideoxygalactose transaminase n=1 Tax=Hymenobacter sp. YIM 151858-1 TaxID=2987688 RepID=UPI002225ED05|nr:dTDP-4-amino-4,6-dideoxygalactose transaminase [Hymenobacter sp. YIM 151858-1]UYZ57439.1 dTDP-4-amino-4,6-dideoxygalactose transaminase [Hymenobacter sp. YIM 151858-1]
MTPTHIPFNKPYQSGRELLYIQEAIKAGQLSGNGRFTKQCQTYFEQQYHIHKALLTTSGTAALEMAALLLNLLPGDEVVVPSFTFTSTANAFVLRGARIVFADSSAEHPNIDVSQLESLITPRTRAIVPVHYAGVSCDMAAIMYLAERFNLAVIEDAAQAIESYYLGKALGSFGQLAAFSFHETKNLIAGEGGLLAVNSPELAPRAEIMWEKGTNRAAFFRGEAAKYQWVDVGSSFLPSELNAAYLWAQLEAKARILEQRRQQWHRYYHAFQEIAAEGLALLPVVPAYAQHNWHIFYLVCRNLPERQQLIQHLAEQNILAVFHYQTLHDSPYYQALHDGRPLPNAQRFADCLVRLPLYFELSEDDQLRVIEAVVNYFDRLRKTSS